MQKNSQPNRDQRIRERPSGIRTHTAFGKTAWERFEEKFTLDPSTDCWLWHGATDSWGYGTVTINNRQFGAHRVSYEYRYGSVPKKPLELDHICRVRWCVNPEHLEPVTGKTNTLRGNTITATNARKTHCPRGHPLSGDNVYAHNGHRSCKICNRERGKARYLATKRAKEFAA